MKNNICKYPWCKKEKHSDKALFCLEHSRSIKQQGKNVLTVAIVAVGTLLKLGKNDNGDK